MLCAKCWFVTLNVHDSLELFVQAEHSSQSIGPGVINGCDRQTEIHCRCL